MASIVRQFRRRQVRVWGGEWLIDGCQTLRGQRARASRRAALLAAATERERLAALAHAADPPPQIAPESKP